MSEQVRWLGGAVMSVVLILITSEKNLGNLRRLPCCQTYGCWSYTL
jgi:hypothetical protein